MDTRNTRPLGRVLVKTSLDHGDIISQFRFYNFLFLFLTLNCGVLVGLRTESRDRIGG